MTLKELIKWRNRAILSFNPYQITRFMRYWNIPIPESKREFWRIVYLAVLQIPEAEESQIMKAEMWLEAYAKWDVKMNDNLHNIHAKKICSRCKEAKPLSEFYKDRAQSDGFRCRCKECDRKKCNLDCFNCKFEECINDSVMTEEEREMVNQFL